MSNKPIIKIKKTKDNPGFIPEYKTSGAAGFDLAASSEFIIDSGCTAMVPTGLMFEIPDGYEIQIRPRSGMSYKTKLRVSNAPGTIDSDYKGEVKILIDNIGDEPYTINKGDRIAQGVINKVEQFIIQETNESLQQTDRGNKGFGSTGDSEATTETV